MPLPDPDQCGGLMPTPTEYDGETMYVCTSCGRTCACRKRFFTACPILEGSDLEPQAAGDR